MSELYECLIEEEREDLVERIQKKYILDIRWFIADNSTTYGGEHFATAFSTEHDLLNYAETQFKRCESLLGDYRNSDFASKSCELTIYADYREIDCVELSDSENNLSRMIFSTAKYTDSKNVVRYYDEDLETLDTMCRSRYISDTIRDAGWMTKSKERLAPQFR